MKKNLALAALALALLFGAAFQSPNSIMEQLKVIQSQNSSLQAQISGLEAQVAALANKGPRKFYLTKTGHNGAEALSACAAGYHMASLWEIHDPSNLRYDTELGLTVADSGFGPPATSLGWIRTGVGAAGVSVAGTDNCFAWTSSSLASFGSLVGLRSQWGSTQLNLVTPWGGSASPCSFPQFVWCVQD